MEIEGSPRPFPVRSVCLGAVAVILACVGAAYLGLLGGHPGFVVAGVAIGLSLLALTLAGPISWYRRGPRTRRRRFVAALRSLVFPLAIAAPLIVFVGSSWACAAMYARHAAGATASGNEASWFATIPFATSGIYLAAAIHRWREAPIGMPSVIVILAASGLTFLMHARMADSFA